MKTLGPEDIKALEAKLRERLLEDQRERSVWGEKGPIPNILASGQRIVAVHNQILSFPAETTYHDFLGFYIKRVFGEEWWAAENTKSDSSAHPVIGWQRKVRNFQLKHTVGRGVQSAPSKGVIGHYYRLAFDLHTIEHQGLLQATLLKRLRVRKQFQGARYEVIVCAAFARAGFEIRFEEEGKGPDKVCEFVATHAQTGASYSVEAKSRHINGVLGHAGEASGKTEPNVRALIWKALQKVALNPRLICIDVNFPPAHTAGVADPQMTWGPVVRSQINEVEAKGGGPAVVIFTNSPLHYLKDDELAQPTVGMLMGLSEPRFQPNDTVSVEREFPGLLRIATAFSNPVPPNWPLNM